MKLLIVDYRITKKCEASLLKEGFSLLKLPRDNNLGEAVGSHPDTVLFYLNGTLVTTADYCDCAPYIFSDIREMRPDIRICFTSDERKAKYPHDCIMNASVVDKLIFCKSDTVSDAVLDLARVGGYKICHTNQGYPACTALIFGNNAITADRGLGDIMAKNGINVTFISQGGISLPPHEYGFIGGASGVVDRKIYFFGDIAFHPDCELITSVIKDAGYTPISLSDEPLTDFGGIIAL